MSDYWYPFYPSLFKSSTRHLTAEQDGIYRRLIDEYMETREPLPDSDIALARIAGVNENKWLDAKRIVIAFFTHSERMFYHQYCDQMLDIQDKKTKRRSKSAEKAAKKRWENNKQNQKVKCATHTTRNAVAMRGNATDTDTDTDTSKKEKKVLKKKTSLEELSIYHIQDWLNKKRSEGKYINTDEVELLEKFKDYCLSKNPNYKDYVAAFRNSFKWDNVPTKGKTNGTNIKQLTKTERINIALDEAEREIELAESGKQALAITNANSTKL